MSEGNLFDMAREIFEKMSTKEIREVTGDLAGITHKKDRRCYACGPRRDGGKMSTSKYRGFCSAKCRAEEVRKTAIDLIYIDLEKRGVSAPDDNPLHGPPKPDWEQQLRMDEQARVNQFKKTYGIFYLSPIDEVAIRQRWSGSFPKSFIERCRRKCLVWRLDAAFGPGEKIEIGEARLAIGNIPYWNF